MYIMTLLRQFKFVGVFKIKNFKIVFCKDILI